MPLSDDQKAILRLLAQREQGYEDLAALMGLSVDEVRAKVATRSPSSKTKGVQAPPLPAEPEPQLRQRPRAKPRPSRRPRRSPSPFRAAAAEAPQPRATTASCSRAAAASRRRWSAVVVAPGAADLAAAAATTRATPAARLRPPQRRRPSETTSGGEAEPTQAVLKPVDGSDATGVAIFGRVEKQRWRCRSKPKAWSRPRKASALHDLARRSRRRKCCRWPRPRSARNGRIGAQVEVPTEVLAYLANETFDQIAITRTDERPLKASLAKATKEKKAPDLHRHRSPPRHDHRPDRRRRARADEAAARSEIALSRAAACPGS